MRYEQAREVLNRVQAEVKVHKLPVGVRDEVLPVGPSGQVSVRIVRPQERKDAIPVILYMHGGDVGDDGEAYAHKLMNANVEVTALHMAGTTHAFMLLNAIADTPAVRAAIEVTCQTLKDVFAQKGTAGAEAA